MASIEFCGVGKRYGDGTEAVKAMSLTITDGELMVFVGPSGCGKTTALRMVAGLETITEGELLIDGTRVNELDPKARDIAMVFQNYALYPYLTVRQNMGFPLKLSGAPKAVIREKVEGVARILDLEAHLDRKPANLSGGQRQRVAMGRAIVRNPKAFLMDEPLSNLDAKLRVQMRTEIERLQRELATTTIYVTHDQTEAMTLGDRVAVMRDGVIQQIGPPRHLYDQPANVFVAGFIGSPAMNFLAGSIDGDRLRMPIGMVALPDHLRQVIDRTGAKRLVCGFRPEHVEDATLIGPEKLDRGISFITRVELVEEMGSDRLAYFSVGDAVSATVDGVSAVAVSDGAASRLVARLDPDADVAERREARLWLDLAKLRVFDADSGEALGSFGGARATVPSA